MSILSPALSFFSIGPQRNFAGIKGYITIQESTTDSLEITQQPVQQGASIADHAFKKPVALTIQIQFGVSTLLGALFGQSLKEVYQSLLQLQTPTAPDVITPFTVNTLKRSYPNMVLVTLGCTTDKKTENVLSITAAFEEVILVPVGLTQIDPKLLKRRKVNSGVQKQGPKQSAFYTGSQAFGLNK